jgi:hypothetical protein
LHIAAIVPARISSINGVVSGSEREKLLIRGTTLDKPTIEFHGSHARSLSLDT